MGTYTTNKNLFMPTVGEIGWGTLVNGNFETIDNFLKPITVSGSIYTFTGNHVGNQSGGSVSATSITNSGTLTNTGKITANGGIGTKALTATTGTFSGNITAGTYNGVVIKNSGTITVSIASGTVPVPRHAEPVNNAVSHGMLPILPYLYNVKYSGEIQFNHTSTGTSTSAGTLVYWDGLSSEGVTFSVPLKSSAILTFANIPYLVVCDSTTYGSLTMTNFRLS